MKIRARTPVSALWILGLSLAVLVLSVVPAGAEGGPTLAASLTPDSANAGAETTFTLTVSPDPGSGPLESISLASPSGFYVGDATWSINGGEASDATIVDNSTVEVTGLSVTSDDTLTVTITAWPTCRTGEVNTWTLDGVQSGEGGGTPFEQQTFSTSVTQPSSCALVFHALVSQLTNVAFTVKVDVVRENDTIDDTYSDEVSLSIENDPGTNDATLTGGGATAPTNGVATFSAKLNRAGTGYVLEACSPGIFDDDVCAPVLEDGLGFLSGAFAVYDSKKDCLNGQSCFTSAALQGQSSTQVTASGQNGKSVKAGVFGVPQAVVGGPGNLSNLDCAGYNEITEVITSFDFDGAGLKTVVDTVSAQQMKEIANQGVSFLQACFGSSLPFTDRFNHPAVLDSTLGLYVGLLKDCPSNKKSLAQFAPCIVSRVGGGGGTGKLTYVAKEGDPGGARH
jgi:hypothetical protein